MIRAHGRRGRDDLLEVRPAGVVGDQCDALARERAHAARVVEVVVADDEVLDRLVRHERARFLDDGQRAVVVQRPLDDDQVVLHLDHHAVMRAAGHVPHAVGGLLALHAHVGIGRLLDVVRHRDVGGGVGLDLRHRELERGEAAVALADLRRELHAPEVAIVGVAHRDGHVAEDGTRHDPVDALDQVGGVEGRGRLEAARDPEGDRAALQRALARQGGLDDAVRGRPELELTVRERDRRRRRRVAHHVPGVVAADDEHQLVLTPHVRAAALGRFQRPRANDVVPERGRVVVHHAREAPHVELGPGLARGVALPDLEDHAAALDLDGLQIGCAERLRGGLERRAAILRIGRDRREQQDRGQQKYQRSHAGPPRGRCGWVAGGTSEPLVRFLDEYIDNNVVPLPRGPTPVR